MTGSSTSACVWLRPRAVRPQWRTRAAPARNVPGRGKSAPAQKARCWICLESSGELLRGCACRGTAGYLHIACLVDWNRHRNNAHAECWQCQKRFVGVLSMAAAEARVRDARASSSNFDCVASTLTVLLVPSRADTLRRCSTITKSLGNSSSALGRITLMWPTPKRTLDPSSACKVNCLRLTRCMKRL